MLRRVELLRWDASVAEAERARDVQRVREIAATDLLEPTLPGVYNGGQWIRCSGGAGARQTASAQLGAHGALDGALFDEIEAGGEWGGRGIYRALLLSVNADAALESGCRLERAILDMPRYIPAIRAWRLGRVVEAVGARPWTHVWEQRYDDLEGLLGDYMLSPYHWGHVDHWFDPEYPDWCVDTHVCHSFCRYSGA